MEKATMDLIVSQGIFAILFLWLFIDTRKENKERESKYQEIIKELADTVNIVKEIKEDVQEIKDKINGGNIYE
ncbi:hypothetical protein UT300013_32990 [Paraclostridium sordellii]